MFVVLMIACSAPADRPVASVSSAWQTRNETERALPTTYRPRPVSPSPTASALGAKGEIIATVNGHPVPRSRVVDLLLRSRGGDVLEQLIGLETAKRSAEAQGLSISDADVDAEYDRSLRRLTDSLASITPDRFDRKAAEPVLDTVLSQRSMSREEFNLIIRRNAYLRKLVAPTRTFSDAERQTEFARLYGRRAEVRHVQLATLAEVERVRTVLVAGRDFGEVASAYSANVASAEARGLLRPFSAEDDSVPAAFRKVAFSLQPGDVSDAVRVGQWYHLIRLERFVPAEQQDLRKVRGVLERSLRNRLAEPAMFALFEKLFREATIRIHDPVLRAAFERLHPERAP